MEAVYPILFLLFKALFILGALGCLIVIPCTAWVWIKDILQGDAEDEHMVAGDPGKTF
ncbi:MAG: hypothetical protein HYX26_01875 [Acidobacteriales bacterium]|nr:hypothetical protein [Terriglobales bacterium]